MVRRPRGLLTLANYSQDDIFHILSYALDFKRSPRSLANVCALEGKSVALVFAKPSTRTRVSFEVAIYETGGHPIYLSASELQLGRGETVEDTARVLSRYVDAIVIRTFSHDEVERLARAASVPVINALTDSHHPCQALADLLTILEKKDRLAGITLAYVGDGNNVCHSLLLAAAKVGMNIRVATPPGYEPDAGVVEEALVAKRSMSEIIVSNDPISAVAGADVVYTDVWASMGQEDEESKRRDDFAAYQVNEGLLAGAGDNVMVMHCLPAHRGQEITAEVMDGPHAVVFDQAENRLHTQKALLATLIGDE